MSALNAVGWIGATLIVLSLMQARVLRFRWMNLTGAVISMVVNGLLGVWPFAAMNAVIAAIDVYWILRLTRERHDQTVYEVVEVGVSDAYLHHVLRVHADDVATTHPTFQLADVLPTSGGTQAAGGPGPAEGGSAVDGPGTGGQTPGRSAFLVLRGDETVGFVLVRDVGAGIAKVELDYVTPRFRDFTPGEFVYRRSGVFADRGFTKLVVDFELDPSDYFHAVGFHRVDSRWERQVEPAA